MLVRVIPTGQAELGGLARCLAQLFPGHDFETVAKREDPDGSRTPYDGFTSCRLRLPRQVGRDNLQKLVGALAGEVLGQRGRRRADLVVLIDDLELPNVDPDPTTKQDQVEVVVESVRQAVRQHLSSLGSDPSANKVEAGLKEHASFHLAVPMIESWLFGDPAAILQVGVPAQRTPRLVPGLDPERLETQDQEYSDDDGSTCTALHAKARYQSKRPRPAWDVRPTVAGMPSERRERHPKAYLQWLCRDSKDDRNCSAYRESKGGSDALSALDWTSMLAQPEWYTAARALVGDLEDLLGRPAVVIPRGREHPALSRTTHRTTRVLRNI